MRLGSKVTSSCVPVVSKKGVELEESISCSIPSRTKTHFVLARGGTGGKLVSLWLHVCYDTNYVWSFLKFTSEKKPGENVPRTRDN